MKFIEYLNDGNEILKNSLQTRGGFVSIVVLQSLQLRRTESLFNHVLDFHERVWAFDAYLSMILLERRSIGVVDFRAFVTFLLLCKD